MKTLELKSALRTAASKNAAAPEELLSLCRREYCSHPRPRRAGRRELVRSQMRFTALPVWALQGALLIFICLVLSAAAPNEDLVPALTLLPFCNRAARFGMREVEAAARFNSSRLMLARLVAVGMGDAVCVSAIALLSGGAAYEVLVLVVMPFLLTCALSLAVLEHAGESAAAVSAALGAVLAAAYWILAGNYTKGLLRISPAVAAMICTAALAALGAECRAMLSEKRLEKELGYES